MPTPCVSVASHGSVRMWLSASGRCRNMRDTSAPMHVDVAERAALRHVRAGQVHLRHLVGGRARSFMGELPWERIFQVTGGSGDGAGVSRAG